MRCHLQPVVFFEQANEGVSINCSCIAKTLFADCIVGSKFDGQFCVLPDLSRIVGTRT